MPLKLPVENHHCEEDVKAIDYARTPGLSHAPVQAQRCLLHGHVPALDNRQLNDPSRYTYSSFLTLANARCAALISLFVFRPAILRLARKMRNSCNHQKRNLKYSGVRSCGLSLILFTVTASSWQV